MPDLEAGIREVGDRLGVRPSLGGSHPGLGTANALLSLGLRSYLEIIGPDPAQPPPARPRPFGVDAIGVPRLVTWAVEETDLDERARRARAVGYDPGETVAMSRERRDGIVLAWRLLVRRELMEGSVPPGDGLVPFFIDWGESPHPAEGAAHGARILDLHGLHPDAKKVHDVLHALGISLPVDAGPEPRLVAVLEGPAGRWEV